MANVRKVIHPSGEISWRATVKTSDGRRKSKNHVRKADADAWVRANDGASATGSATMLVIDLARDHNRWFDGLVKAGERAQLTSDGYDSHLRIHLAPDPIAKTKLCDLDTPGAQQFLDRIIAKTGSVETARRVKKSLSAWCAHGQRNGVLKFNPVDGTKVVQKRKRRAEAKVFIPPKDQLAALLRASSEGPDGIRGSAVIHLLMFAGPRISELLGMADASVELRRPDASGRAGGLLRIHETLCSRHVTLGEVKSDDGLRDVPIGPSAAAAVRTWRVARGPVAVDTVDGARVMGRLFPGPPGGRHGPFWSYSDFRRLFWNPLMVRAGLGREVKKGAHNRITVDFGPHTLRHVFASIQIENGVTPKRLQALMGHATLAMTMDLYGHLWTDDAGDQAMAESSERIITSRT